MIKVLKLINYNVGVNQLVLASEGQLFNFQEISIFLKNLNEINDNYYALLPNYSTTIKLLSNITVIYALTGTYGCCVCVREIVHCISMQCSFT